jgi:hypothetical protein
MTTLSPALLRQQAHVAKLRKEHFNYGLTVGAAFVRGIRKMGYKTTGTALDELLDNSKQAGATAVHVVFNPDRDRKGSIGEIAVVDNGVAMIPRC